MCSHHNAPVPLRHSLGNYSKHLSRVPQNLKSQHTKASQQHDTTEDRTWRYLSPLILNHASAHCRCAAPSSSLQPQPSLITSDTGTSKPTPSVPRWQIRHSAGRGALSMTSMTTASVGTATIDDRDDAPAAVSSAAAASRRMRRGGSSRRARRFWRGYC
jgi:hypothetical protein